MIYLPCSLQNLILLILLFYKLFYSISFSIFCQYLFYPLAIRTIYSKFPHRSSPMPAPPALLPAPSGMRPNE